MRAVRRSHVRAGDPSLVVQGSLGSGAFNLSGCALFRTVRAADPWMATLGRSVAWIRHIGR